MQQEVTNNHQKWEDKVMSMPVMTMDEFNERCKTEDICYEIDDERCSDDPDEFFDDINYGLDEGEENIIHWTSNIPVYKKEKWHITESWLEETISDYLEDNFSYSYWDCGELPGLQYIKEFVDKFNADSNGYTAGELIGRLDLSKEVLEYLKEQEVD